MKIKDILLCWDFLVSLGIGLIIYFLLPNCLLNEVILYYYQIGITVLSIVFSIFFAALAIIITSPDNDFVRFLEIDNVYTKLIELFKYTLYALFTGLLYSIFAAGITTYIKESYQYQHKVFLSLFLFIFFYGLFCTVHSTKQVITYALHRAKFIKANDQKEKENPRANDEADK